MFALALARKNLACLITNHTSSVRKSDVPHSLSLHFFSTRRRERQFDTNHEIHDVLLHKHNFSPEVASLAASSHYTEFRSPIKADLILSFLEECGFSSNQLEKIVKIDPRILSRNVEDIKLKIKILQDLGLSPEDIAKIVTGNQVILNLSTNNKIIPAITSLKSLLGSDDDVARLIRKSGRVISANLGTTLLPNVELLKSCGIPMEHILYLLYTYPRCLLVKPDITRKSVDKAKEIGLSKNSKMFVYALSYFVGLSKGMWELKLQGFQDLGFSHSDTLAMFRKSPQLLSLRMTKITKVTELLLATGKFSISSIANNPACFGCSIDNRLKPRLRVLEHLESRNLIKKWPGIGVFYTLSDDKFSERYIRPYWDDVGEALDPKGHAKGESKER